MSGSLHFSSIAFRSEIGLHREGNEDSGLAATNLIAVADGMGGYAGGEVASSTVIRTLANYLPIIGSDELDRDSRDDLLRSSIVEMDRSIREAASLRPELNGMGTTITALSLIEDQIHLLHVGDSRAYRIREGSITRLSQDHTVVQELLDQGRITLDEISEHPQRSLLTQALMGKEDIEPVLHIYPVRSGDIYLVCSDGLTAVVTEGEIRDALANPLSNALDLLIDLTYKRGAPDNVTLVAASVGTQVSQIAPTFIGASS